MHVPLFGIMEASLEHGGDYANPYIQVDAAAILVAPDGERRWVSLFWDGGRTWRLRFSPDQVGRWTYIVQSGDAALRGRGGSFEVMRSNLPGSIVPHPQFPRHFARQNGEGYYPQGDTCWPALANIPDKQLSRDMFESYVRLRASQGFNWLQVCLLREDANEGGVPFGDFASQTLNPAYFQEADRRVLFINDAGMVAMIMLTWGGGGDRLTWRLFGDDAARMRFIRYAMGRYAAYATAFCVSGEWNKWLPREDARDDALAGPVRRTMCKLGKAAADAGAAANRRMVGIHCSSAMASTREFAAEPWCSFGDFQQNYWGLHAETLASLATGKPVVNGEYAYFLRDETGNGCDKNNSATVDDIRHAAWDIAMAGGYSVTGFGSTYNGGRREVGPFAPDAAKNEPWQRQCGLIREFFESLDYRRIECDDSLVSADVSRGSDIMKGNARTESNYVRPPLTTYWAMSDGGGTFVVYVRGLSSPVTLAIGRRAEVFAELLDPRTGRREQTPVRVENSTASLTPPDEQDWVFVVRCGND